MSQVVVTKDLYLTKRKTTLQQERSIDTTSRLKAWTRSDATKTLGVEKILGIVTMPVLLFWVFVCTLLSVGIGLAMVIFNGIGAIWPKSQV